MSLRRAKMDYDVVIIGAGPGGLAASIKARELGLNCLTIEKGNDVLAGLVGLSPPGKSVYPVVAPGVSQNEFAIPFLKPPEDKIPIEDYLKRVKEGVKEWVKDGGLNINFNEEFVGFKKDGSIAVQTSRKEYTTKNLVLAIGSSVPRDLSIYGEARTITRTLHRPEDYQGKNVLVIGGGNAGAGIVMSLSKTKRERDDSTKVYWTSRYEKFNIDREVARDLGEEILLGGNIRILQGARPILSEIDEPGGEEKLAIRTDEILMGDDVKRTYGMCFPLKNVIVCIGFKRPAAVFEKLGIELKLREGAKKGTGVVILDDKFQTSVKGIYAIGGAISPTYLCKNWVNGHQEKVRHPNIIHTAVKDGVSVIEHIAGEVKSSNGA
jgi:thioredoxin reductase